MRWLIVSLEAPLASFGEAAGNAQRGTAMRPTRSALIGLAGAALGILREDDAAQDQLSSSFTTATRTLDAGQLLRDFHTYQSVPQAKGIFSTRAKALASGGAVTSITEREYRCDGKWQAAFGEKSGEGFTLEELSQAFTQPYFSLWLGRKSCPLSCPLGPLIIDRENLEAAFDEHAKRWQLEIKNTRTLIATDIQPHSKSLQRKRMDHPRDRKVWTFAARDEWEFMTGGTDES
jgi:CRISPR system Cascade subunit CasD